jgi:hypothetical protein
MANPLPIKITDLDTLDSVANDDIFLAIDRSEQTVSVNGETKNVTAQILKNYIFSDFTFGSVNNHTDISITTPTGDQLLKYDATAQKWINWTPNYVTSDDVNLDNVVRDTDFVSTGLLKRGAEEGDYSVINDNSTNWNTAYEWGNHASAGYLTSAGLGSVSINALSDVDMVSNSPTNGQVLTWAQPDPGIDGKWVPSTINTSAGEVTLSSFSVAAEPTPSGDGSLQYAQSTGVFTYTPPNLSSFLTSANLTTALNNSSINSFNDVNTESNPPTSGQVLAWDNNNWVPTTLNLSGVTDGDKDDISVSNNGGTWTIDNDTVTYAKMQNVSASKRLLGRYGTGAGDVQEITIGDGLNLSSGGELTSSGGTGLQSRTTASGTLSNLVNNNSASDGQLDIANVAKTYALLKIQTSQAAWVTLYTSGAARDADASRTETTDPLPGSGVIAEIITTEGVIQSITPGTLGWNNDATPTSTVYAKVVNKSGITNNITVTLTYVALEG